MSLNRFRSISAPVAGASLAALAAVSVALAGPPAAVEKTVNCDAGQSINAAIASGFTNIVVAGECDENVVISVDGVSLRSDDANPGAIRPALGLPLNVTGADGVSVTDLEIEALNAQNAVLATHARANLVGVTVIGGDAYALEARQNSSIFFGRGVISGATNGAHVSTSSSMEISQSTVEDVNTLAVTSSGGSYLRVSGSALDGTGPGSNRTGVSVAIGSAAEIAGVTVSGFPSAGVRVVGGSLRIFGAEISGNGGGTNFYPGVGGVVIGAGGSAEIIGVTEITGNTGVGLLLADSSGATCAGAVDISGNTVTDVDISAGSEAVDC